MHYKTIHIFPSDDFLNDENTHVSFKKFVEFLEEKLKEDDSLKSKFYRFVIKHFKRHPELFGSVCIYDLKNYSHLFNLLEGVILPHLINEKEFALALGVPLNPVFFLETDAFYNLLENKPADVMLDDFAEREKIIEYRHKKKSYELILDQLFNYQPLIKEEFVHTRTDKKTNLTKYFSLNIDNRFVEVKCDGELPSINITQVQQQLSSIDTIHALEKVLPLSKFAFSGFSIVTTEDITARYALHKMRSVIIRHNPDDYNGTYKQIVELLEQLCGTQDVSFGLLPFLKLNDRLVSYYGDYAHSIMINICKRLKISETKFLDWINAYYQNPQTIIKKECSIENKKDDELYKAFSELGFNGYALLPVFYNNEVAGMLEISAKDTDLIDETLLSRIDSATPILSQLMHQSQTEFVANITNVIRQNFTSIQPSVLWKFNEVAWDYLKDAGNEPMRKLDEIRFEHLHPLYGAIDIRNSTIERNNALHKDMHYYFKMTKDVLKQLHVSNNTIVEELIHEAESFLNETENFFTGNEESSLDSFMERVKFYLNGIEDSGAHNKNLVKKYYKEIDEKNGKAFASRRVLENSMQYINFIITGHLEKMQEDLQKKYPIYFEKIRTDGIEYDMYLGQSISPKHQYKKSYLNELRLLQLENMATITKLVSEASKVLPVHLQTTQLIYVNASSIDITFRMDEKRFDVEGGYNIRYHVIKKRIDKVHVTDTGERLTQPRKLAIIYTQPHHEKEYLNYITELQKKDILTHNVELLELEELQGVTGLKAIRVEVNINN